VENGTARFPVKNDNQRKKIFYVFHIEIFDTQHTVIMKIQFELDWSDLNDCSTKEVPYIIYPYYVIKILKDHFEFAQFRHYV